MRKKIAAGNWKMNGLTEDLGELRALAATHPSPSCEVIICPPAPLLVPAAAEGGSVQIGGQDCHSAVSGAHTGDISAQMLQDAGATSVIVGHSERRQDHGESNDIVCAKAQAAIAAGLVAIICIGESLDERKAGQTLDVLNAQLAGSVPAGVTGADVVIAYEPIWAIGTGEVATPDQIAQAHGAIRATLAGRFGQETADGISLLYGGSVKPGNAAEIFAVSDVDGALVGGASLKAEDFSAIVSALETA